MAHSLHLFLKHNSGYSAHLQRVCGFVSVRGQYHGRPSLALSTSAQLSCPECCVATSCAAAQVRRRACLSSILMVPNYLALALDRNGVRRGWGFPECRYSALPRRCQRKECELVLNGRREGNARTGLIGEYAIRFPYGVGRYRWSWPRTSRTQCAGLMAMKHTSLSMANEDRG